MCKLKIFPSVPIGTGPRGLDRVQSLTRVSLSSARSGCFGIRQRVGRTILLTVNVVAQVGGGYFRV